MKQFTVIGRSGETGASVASLVTQVPRVANGTALIPHHQIAVDSVPATVQSQGSVIPIPALVSIYHPLHPNYFHFIPGGLGQALDQDLSLCNVSHGWI